LFYLSTKLVTDDNDDIAKHCPLRMSFVIFKQLSPSTSLSSPHLSHSFWLIGALYGYGLMANLISAQTYSTWPCFGHFPCASLANYQLGHTKAEKGRYLRSANDIHVGLFA